MGFWIFMFICCGMLIPLAMIGFGVLFVIRSPKKVNYLFGYRTSMSMKNDYTWKYAHKVAGVSWLIGGCIILVPSIIVMVSLLEVDENTLSYRSLILCGIQIIVMTISVIVPTEVALRRKFDKNGNIEK